MGTTYFSTCIVEEGLCEPDEIELMAILRRLQLYLGMGMRKLILESDHLSIITACLSRDVSFLKIGSMVTKVQQIQISFKDRQLQHMYREHNNLAHFIEHHT